MRHRYAISIMSLFLLSQGLAAAESPFEAFEGRSIVSVGFEPADQPLEQRELKNVKNHFKTSNKC